jgi:dihydroflavonol-4-reductase
MLAAQKHKVKRVVITSSIAAISIKDKKNRKPHYTEEDWSDLGEADAYCKSKTLAEQTAWRCQ